MAGIQDLEGTTVEFLSGRRATAVTGGYDDVDSLVERQQPTTSLRRSPTVRTSASLPTREVTRNSRFTLRRPSPPRRAGVWAKFTERAHPRWFRDNVDAEVSGTTAKQQPNSENSLVAFRKPVDGRQDVTADAELTCRP